MLLFDTLGRCGYGRGKDSIRGSDLVQWHVKLCYSLRALVVGAYGLYSLVASDRCQSRPQNNSGTIDSIGSFVDIVVISNGLTPSTSGDLRLNRHWIQC